MDFVHACSLEREEAEDLIKRHGGRVTGSVNKKTVSYCFYTIFCFSSFGIYKNLPTLSVCRVIFYVMNILRDENLAKLKSLGRLSQFQTLTFFAFLILWLMLIANSDFII